MLTHQVGPSLRFLFQERFLQARHQGLGIGLLLLFRGLLLQVR